ncbi:hypothetical protein HZP98_04470 [Elizabethkingia anophelis]|nr:hypothetical protein [Elizabethkingia anophelis]MCT3951276.1 hypothetical protein [Elizabethkingia anophelis]MCT3954819.1 hypothetical protein [Elizabethkingia anophelis]MCT3986755.1 hypothetical protein [Elizabethkingia anophelis]MCT4064938.1 hypothetical protein [Elizabethkingia anophelis]
MYQTLTFYHNSMRWLVLLSLLLALYRAYKGYFSKSEFSKTDNAIRHWTATIAHIQLMIGMILYFQSPMIQYFFANFKTAVHQDFSMLFFGLIHSSLMLISIVLITIGSASSKRKETDTAKFKTMMIWFTIALVIIFIAIPWPFSPLANRPYFR